MKFINLLKNQFLYFFLMLWFNGVSQQYNFQNFTTKDGLPSNEIYNVFQDKHGLIWFATDRGLSSYNGYEFKNYATNDGLTDICIFEFFPQKNNQIWCSTFNNKFFYFENGTNRFIPYKFNYQIAQFFKKKRIRYFIAKDIVLDKNDQLFLSNGNLVFFVDNNGTIHQINHTEKKRSKFFLNEIKIGNSGTINYLTDKVSDFPILKECHIINDINKINLNTKFFLADGNACIIKKKVSCKNFNNEKDVVVSAGVYKNKMLWLGLKGTGVKISDFSGSLKESFQIEGSVTHLLIDLFGGIWISTTNAGVYYKPINCIRTYHLDDENVHSLDVNHNNNLVGATTEGMIFTIENEKIKKIRSKNKFGASQIHYQKNRDEFYVFQDDQLKKNNSKISNFYGRILKFSDDSRDDFCFSQYNTIAAIRSNQVKRDTLNFRVNDLSFVNKRWFLATIDGLKIKYKNHLQSFNDGLLSHRMDDIDYDYKNKIFWIATLGKGLLGYDGKNVIAIDKSKGLSDNLATEVYLENENTIWVCTNRGLNRIQYYSKKKFKIDYITASNGLISNQVKDVEIIGNTIYIATTSGLCSLTKKEFNNLLSIKKYFLRLKKVLVKNKPVGLIDGKLNLKYSQNQIDFTVEAVSYSGGKNLSYQYRMIGLDEKWNRTYQRKISYEFIPPGDYNFVVKVLEDNRSFSNEELIVPLSISKPFWKTFWFVGLIICIATFITYLFFKIKVLIYNRDITREILRLMMRKIKKKDNYFAFKEGGKLIRIPTDIILYIKSSGNYIDIITENKTYTIREKLSNFLELVPDPLEFLRIHRSCIIRIDKVEQKTKKSVVINNIEIKVGETYLAQLQKIIF